MDKLICVEDIKEAPIQEEEQHPSIEAKFKRPSSSYKYYFKKAKIENIPITKVDIPINIVDQSPNKDLISIPSSSTNNILLIEEENVKSHFSNPTSDHTQDQKPSLENETKQE